ALTMIPWGPDRFKYLGACDLVVSRAGHETIMQSICYRKPMILVPTPGHTEQYGNARRARELGVAEAVHQWELTQERLLTLVQRILGDTHYAERLREINSNNSLGDGVENVVEAVGEFLRGA
ncbi:MAG: glycosyltransferase, partial [Candidatus Bathyarchaeia archaeon]